jgi:hypothetical protein
MTLFDFPLPINTVEQRNVTNVPVQRLFLMNSSFVETQARSFAKRLTAVLSAHRRGLKLPNLFD